MQQENFQNIIDHRNIDLWKELQDHFIIEVFIHDQPESRSFSKDNNIKIYLSKNAGPATFTHELLHTLLEKKEVDIGSTLKILLNQSKRLKKIFSKKLLDHIGNVCDHIIMYPIYISLGFSDKEFLFDNEENKCTPEEIETIIKHFRFLWFYRIAAIDLYIGKFFAICADHNEAIDYSYSLEKLQSLDSELFKALQKFIDSWKSLNIDDMSCENNTLITITVDFIYNLENWIKRKVLI